MKEILVRFLYFCVLLAAILAAGFELFHFLTQPCNPWKKYGVTAEWFGYGNTGLTGARYTAQYAGRSISQEIDPGAQYNFDLSSRDIDHDGIPELIMADGKRRLVLAFRPARNGTPPEFHVLENDFAP